MTELRQVTNQELLQELRSRIRSKQINFSFPWQKDKDWEKKLDQAYKEWANDPEEQEEIKLWKGVESDGWDD